MYSNVGCYQLKKDLFTQNHIRSEPPDNHNSNFKSKYTKESGKGVYILTLKKVMKPQGKKEKEKKGTQGSYKKQPETLEQNDSKYVPINNYLHVIVLQSKEIEWLNVLKKQKQNKSKRHNYILPMRDLLQKQRYTQTKSESMGKYFSWKWN